MKKAVRIGGMVLTDAVLINLSYLIAFLLRFDFTVRSHGGGELLAQFGKWWLLLTLIKLVIFAAVGMYTSLWRFAGGGEFLRVAGGILLGNLAAGAFLLIIGSRFPVGMLVLVMLLDLLLTLTGRDGADAAICDHPLAEAAYYPADRALAVLNNSDQPLTTAVSCPGGRIEVTLDPLETRILTI